MSSLDKIRASAREGQRKIELIKKSEHIEMPELAIMRQVMIEEIQRIVDDVDLRQQIINAFKNENKTTAIDRGYNYNFIHVLDTICMQIQQKNEISNIYIWLFTECALNDKILVQNGQIVGLASRNNVAWEANSQRPGNEFRLRTLQRIMELEKQRIAAQKEEQTINTTN